MMEYNTNSDTTPVESRKKQMYTQEHADALRAENERLRGVLTEIANSAGIDGCGYTTGEGHSNCIWKARKSLNEVKE